MDSLDVLISPRNVAIIGASSDPNKMSGRPLANFRRFGFAGKVFPVNSNRQEVQGYRAFASIGAIDQPIDLALVMTPAAAATAAVREGIAAGCKSFIIFSAGYSEYNAAGAKQQHDLAMMVAGANARMLGPNCAGMINAHENLCATFSTVVDQMTMSPGSISFVGQSGAMAAYWLEKTLHAGLGFAKWISTGNEANISLADAIVYLAADDLTQCICAYVEGTRDGPALRHAFDVALAAGKPVIILRSGKSAAGASAAASHTGAMAGEDAVWRALFQQTGVIECRSLTEMVNLTRLMQRQPSRALRKPLIMSVSGGAGALATDAATAAGMEIAPLSERLSADLHRILPDLGQLANPVDLTANATADYGLFRRTAEAAVADDGFDSFIIFFGLMHQAKDEIPKVIDEVFCQSGKPVVVIWMSASEGVKAALRDRNIISFDDIPEAIDAVAAWNRWCDAQRKALMPAEMHRFDRAIQGTAMSEYTGQRHLGAVPGMRWPKSTLLQNATTLSDYNVPEGPWVVKVQSAEMPHKTEYGGVAVNIADLTQLAAIIERMASLGDTLDIAMDGVLVQEMVPHAHELLVGIRTDPIFGPLLVVGRGGTEAEYEKDLCIRLLPVSSMQIEEMLSELRYADRLGGVRGKGRIDLAAVAAPIHALCQIFETDPAIVEIEINPLAVSPPGDVVPLDLLITVGSVAAGVRDA